MNKIQSALLTLNNGIINNVLDANEKELVKSLARMVSNESYEGRTVEKGAPVNDEVWITADNRRLKVGELTEDHLREVLRMILRNRRRARELRASLARLSRLAEEEFHEERSWGENL